MVGVNGHIDGKPGFRDGVLDIGYALIRPEEWGKPIEGD